jgi:tetratricopeptide (TPR) repeat protein
MFYNDQPPDMIFYQGLAYKKLGQLTEAQKIFQKLVDYGQSHMIDEVKIDYFAISLPNFLVFDEDLNERNRIHCHYMIALGEIGLGKYVSAQEQLEEVLRLDSNHLGAVLHKKLVRSD